MPRAVRWSETALRQLEAVRQFVEQDKPIAAFRLAYRIRNSTNILANFPDAGRVGPALGTRQWAIPGTRYIANYTVVGNEVRILSLHHGMIDWKPRED
jgi:toxin ParE1/3/4